MTRLAAETGIDVADLSAEDLVRQRPAARVLIEELDGIVREIESSGAHLKDVKLGLVDFPAEREGEIVYLCWQSGEPRSRSGIAPTRASRTAAAPGIRQDPYLQ
jgi:hypothetical protein